MTTNNKTNTERTVDEWEKKLNDVEESYPMALHTWSPEDWIDFIRTTLLAERQRAEGVVREIIESAPGFENSITHEVTFDAGVMEYIARIKAIATRNDIQV